MKIQRLDAFKKKLARLPEATRAEVRAALQKSAEEMVEVARRAVPVDKGDLRDSIGWTFGDAPAGSVVIAKTTKDAVRQAGLSVTIYAGSKTAFYAGFQEFGTRKMAANPFFFPAYRLTKKRARSRITRATTKAAKRVAAGG